jgi:uncharacterized membrane protein
MPSQEKFCAARRHCKYSLAVQASAHWVLPMEADRLTLKSLLVAGWSLIGSGLIFVFLQLSADVIPALCSSPPLARRFAPPAVYFVGLFMLVVGAGLMIFAAFTGREKPT